MSELDQPDVFLEFVHTIETKNALFVAGTGVSRSACPTSPLASWKGLLLDGIAYCGQINPKNGGLWNARRGELLEAWDQGDTAGIVRIAAEIEEALGGPNRRGGAYRRWLRRTIGSLAVSDSRVPDLLHLLSNGCIATCNYDDVLTRPTSPPAVWTNSAAMIRVIQGSPGIAHLHGHWKEPESVVLGTKSYEAVIGSPAAQALQRAIGTLRSLTFVGMGAGLEDPNLAGLLEWMATALAESETPHYRLVCRAELQSSNQPTFLVPLVYGETHDDLVPFLERTARAARLLAPATDRQQPKPAPTDRRRHLWITAHREARGRACTILVSSADADALRELANEFERRRQGEPGLAPSLSDPSYRVTPEDLSSSPRLAQIALESLGVANLAIFASIGRQESGESVDHLEERLVNALLPDRLRSRHGTNSIMVTSKVIEDYAVRARSAANVPASIVFPFSPRIAETLLQFAGRVILDRSENERIGGDYDLILPRVAHIWNTETLREET